MSCFLFNPYADKKISVKECFIMALDISLDKLEASIYGLGWLTIDTLSEQK